jgi:hypothetical protein
MSRLESLRELSIIVKPKKKRKEKKRKGSYALDIHYDGSPNEP